MGFAISSATGSNVSQTSTPRSLSIDAAYELSQDGVLRPRRVPVHALAVFDRYALGAHMLRDLLATT
jgi:hypothetical protein